MNKQQSLNNWFKTNFKFAATEDSLNGRLMKDRFKEVLSDVEVLKKKVSRGGPDNLLPRFKSQVVDMIRLLPPANRIAMMNFYEVEELRQKIEGVKKAMARYRNIS